MGGTQACNTVVCVILVSVVLTAVSSSAPRLLIPWTKRPAQSTPNGKPGAHTPPDQESKVATDGTKSSPSLGSHQGNTVLVREWNAPTRTASTGKDAAVPYIPYNPIKEYPCNGAPAGDYCSGRGN